MLRNWLALPARFANQLRLIWDNPEEAGRNLLQVIDPTRFEAKVLDVMRQPPLHLEVGAAGEVTLNVLQPVLQPDSMTGGPNTIVVLAALVAEAGVPVRFVTNRPGHRPDPEWFNEHVASLLGRHPPPLKLAVASDPKNPVAVGSDDIWFATHWTTVQGLKSVLPRMRHSWFFYFVQDFEPGFYAWSSNYALALETYEMNFRAVINERFLAQHLVQQSIGRFASPGFLDRNCRVFEPAVDRRVFYAPVTPQAGDTRTLLFYARPTNARNMVGLGTQALRDAVASGVFGPEWRFFAIGTRGSLPTISLGGGHKLHPAVWHNYEDYANALRTAEILLCPMLSPHSSYPVLEMAACGGRVVTNSYGPKSPAALKALSSLIHAASPTIEGIAAALAEAASAGPPSPRTDQLALASTWDEVLEPVASWIASLIGSEAT